MTIDLSKLQAGDKVKFRCGGEAVVADIATFDRQSHLNLRFAGAEDLENDSWMPTGLFYRNKSGSRRHPFDIIEITPKAFDWSDVRPGMAFDDFGRMILITGVGEGASYVEIKTESIGSWRGKCSFDGLKRLPQHDIPTDTKGMML